MKKLVSGFLVLLLCGVTFLPQVSATSGNINFLGTAYPGFYISIYWYIQVGLDYDHTYCSIELWRNNVYLVTIDDNVTGTGQFEWRIPANTQVGNGYQLRLTYLHDPSYQVLCNFSIYSLPTINVLSPLQGDILIPGEYTNIGWQITQQAGSNGVPRFDLYRGETYISSITSWYYGGSPYHWHIADNLPLGSGYTIKAHVYFVYNENNNITGTSGSFSFGGKTLTINSPQNGFTWYTGQPHQIEWSSNFENGTIRIDLFRNGGFLSTLDNNCPVANYAYTWYTAVGLDSGSGYQIKLTNNQDASIHATSEVFTITARPPAFSFSYDSLRNVITVTATESGHYYNEFRFRPYTYDRTNQGRELYVQPGMTVGMTGPVSTTELKTGDTIVGFPNGAYDITYKDSWSSLYQFTVVNSPIQRQLILTTVGPHGNHTVIDEGELLTIYADYFDPNQGMTRVTNYTVHAFGNTYYPPGGPETLLTILTPRVTQDTLYSIIATKEGLLSMTNQITVKNISYEPPGWRPPQTRVPDIQFTYNSNTNELTITSIDSLNQYYYSDSTDPTQANLIFDWNGNRFFEYVLQDFTVETVGSLTTNQIQQGDVLSGFFPGHYYMYWRSGGGYIGTFVVPESDRMLPLIITQWSDYGGEAIEGKEFSIYVRTYEFTSHGTDPFSSAMLNPAEHATVQFMNQIAETGTSSDVFSDYWGVTFTAPYVDHDTYYPVTASKTGYSSTTRYVLVRNTPYSQNGSVSGTVYLRSHGKTIPASQYHIRLQRDDTSQITDWHLIPFDFHPTELTTNQDGMYTFMLLGPGRYHLQASDASFNGNSSQFMLTSDEHKIINLTVDVSNEFLLLSQAKRDGSVGAEITITNANKYTLKNYTGVVVLPKLFTKGKISFIVWGDEYTSGKIIAVTIDRSFLDSTKGLTLELDGQPIQMASDVTNFFADTDSAIALYIITEGLNGTEVLIRVPHYSIHEITIEQIIAELGGITAVIMYVIIIGVVAVVYVVPIWVLRRK
ncbi:MAG: Ser-Thr-rich GPI-anchored membrane family protein [Methanobacteriota archaeon]